MRNLLRALVGALFVAIFLFSAGVQLSAAESIWLEDAVPAGAVAGTSGGDAWAWITHGPMPASGGLAHQSRRLAGLHEHYYTGATVAQSVATGDVLFTYVYLDASAPPTEIMLSWNEAGSWEHRAYWGANLIANGANGTVARNYMGPLPTSGGWVRLNVPASAVGLEGRAVVGMAFSQFDGRATWDKSGVATSGTSLPSGSGLPSVTVAATDATAVIASSDIGLLTFTRSGATTGSLTVNYALSGSAVKWTDYRRVEGDMPVTVTIPAGAASATMTIAAFANVTNANPETAIFTLTADPAYAIGASSSATLIIGATVVATLPTVALVATDASAAINSTDTALLTFTRSGDTTGPLTVNYTLAGTAVKWTDYRRLEGDMPVAITIPAGAASATMTIAAFANVTSANPETAIFTLTADPAYTVGASSSATLTIGATTPITPPAPTPTPTPVLVPTGSLDELDYTGLIMPSVGNHAAHVISPTWIELRRLNTKLADPARVDSWDFVDASGVYTAPAQTEFAVTVAGQNVNVISVGFRRRPFYAPLSARDLRIDNALFLQLATPVADGQVVVVTNPDARLWPATDSYVVTADPMRYSPAIHVNQEGYVPGFPKKAMVGYYLGDRGELDVPVAGGFKVVNAVTGATVYQGPLTARADVGYYYSATPYQKVLQADFSPVTTPGEYYVVVPGMGASLPFVINEGIAMGFLRTYALGIYHQRCGTSNAMPFTRFVHDACHLPKAEVLTSDPAFNFSWTTIASKNSDYASNPRHTAPQLVSPATQLYPYINAGPVDTAGGHHDAGDYSKYTINCAALTHLLMFTADSIAGAGALDNLGLPESGDGVSDVLQEAKQESDYLAKLQDADGGFYFIVYPKNLEYESDVLPDHGYPQVVWPKNTSATAASVAALAQCASSPQFKARYPLEAAAYLQRAKLGWQFLMNAIAKYGKDGAYQKITFYGDNFMHDDELAWAACEMYLATGDTQYQAKLFEYFPDPANSSTFRWGWWRMSESWGNAIRSYAFAARSGRLALAQLDSTYLAKCEAQIVAAGDDALRWSTQNAYASSFPEETKHVRGAGWYFSLDQASDMAVAYQLNPKPAYLDALVGNMNYEGGTNPVNATYLTGLGLKRQHEIVNQYAKNDRRVLPPTGIPIGNIQSNFDYLPTYGSELNALVFPSDNLGTSPYPYYDRWSDTWNVTTEFVTLNQARSVLSLCVLANQTTAKSAAWKSGTALIAVPAGVVPVGAPVTLSVTTPGLDLTGSRIVWESRDQQPAFGSSCAFTPVNNGLQWVEVEVEWPDGRRVFGVSSYSANSPVQNWVNGAVPAGAQTSASGGDAWTWVTTNPAPLSAPAVHQSNLAAGVHEHSFAYTTSTLAVGVGDKLFAWVYLDPANPPTEIMLTWNDGSADHRAYWGANQITWGTNGTAGQYPVGPLPAAGQWVRLEVPASAVALEGSLVNGMCFALYGGRASWDVAGKTSPTN